MRSRLPLKSRITKMLVDDYSTLTLFLGLAAVLLSLGFVLSGQAVFLNKNYSLLLDLAHPFFWVGSFLVYGVLKITTSVVRLPSYIEIALSTYGIWLWTYIVLSFIVFDKRAPAPTELILCIPTLCEVWVLALILYNSKEKRS